MSDIYSKRQRRNDGNNPQVYKFDQLPEPLRVQIIYIWGEILDHLTPVRLSGAEGFFRDVYHALCEEYGLFQLTYKSSNTLEGHVCNFFLDQRDVEKCLDVIEIVFACLVRFVQADTHVMFDGGNHIQRGIEKLNARFQEHAVGYEFRDGKMIRIDSQIMHSEAVAPAMELLHEPYLAGANQEFLKAHEHFRHDRLGECINECLKAFESTMKAICHKRGWSYDQNDTAKTLLATCEKKGLFPTFMQSSLSGLRSVLENVATVRNKLSGHGQGARPVLIEKEFAAFALHSTGANILFLASLAKRLN
ncbi:MAG: hypothetical protein HY300_12310 [Verrucomicrobia bacterium]|nr:hypothetical protein [Verrucomicrobiota bacterium]